MEMKRMDTDSIEILQDLAASNKAIAEAVLAVLNSPIVVRGELFPPVTSVSDGNTVFHLPD